MCGSTAFESGGDAREGCGVLLDAFGGGVLRGRGTANQATRMVANPLAGGCC